MLCGIALGSNIGDRLTNLCQARGLLGNVGEASAASPIYQTEPVGCPPGSLPFLNCVLLLRTSLSLEALHDATRGIEKSLGRADRAPRHAPRCIDLDLLFYGDQQSRSESLEIPHPRLHLRRFVLEPLAAIAPSLVIPGLNKSAATLLAELRSAEPPLRVFLQKW